MSKDSVLSSRGFLLKLPAIRSDSRSAVTAENSLSDRDQPKAVRVNVLNGKDVLDQKEDILKF